MTSKNLGKKILVLIFLLAVLIGIFIWQSKDFGEQYFGWLKTGLARVNPFKTIIGPELELSEDSGLDVSDVNIDQILAEQREGQQEQKQEQEQAQEQEESVSDKEIIIGIGGPIEESVIIEKPEPDQEKEVIISEKKMTLGEIEQEVNRITKEVERIEKEVQALIGLNELQKNG